MHARKALGFGLLALMLVILPLFARSASAAPIATASRPVSPAIGYSRTDGTFLAVWAEDRGTGTGLDLYGARVTATGIVAGKEVPIIVKAGDQSDPTLAFSERNRSYMLIYTDDSGGATAPPSTPGVPIPGGTATLPIPGGTPGPGTTPPPPPPPPPAPFASGGLLGFGAASTDLIDASALSQMGSAPLIAAGASLGPDQPLPTIPPPTPGPPPTGIPPLPTPGGTTQPPGPTPPGTPGQTPTPDPGGPPSPPTASGSRDLYGTWLSPSGIRVTNIFPVVTSPADDTFPDLGLIQRTNSDQFALVWREVTGTDARISVMRLEGRGYYFVPYAKATVVTGGDLGRPSVAGEVNVGEFNVVWAQTPKDSPARDIYGRKLNSNAYPYGPVRTVVTGTDDQTYPSIASLGLAGGYLLAWEARQPGDVPDIRVRRLNRNGIPMRAEYNLAGGPPFSFAPDIASSDASSTLIVWLDRNAASDNSVIGAQVNREGRRLGPERLIVQGGTGPSAVTPVAPPGFPTPPVPPPVPPPLPTP